MVRIREASQSDCSEVLQMIRELAEFEKMDPATTVTSTVETLIRDGFTDDEKWFHILVAEEESENGEKDEIGKDKNQPKGVKSIVGFAFFYHTYSTWQGRLVKIEDLYVKPKWRSGGVGTRLLREVAKYAVVKKCVRVHWNVLDWNADAIRFYERLGARLEPEWKVCVLRDDNLTTFANSE